MSRWSAIALVAASAACWNDRGTRACERVRDLAADAGMPRDSPVACIAEMQKLEKADPGRYACATDCILRAPDLGTSKRCVDACPAASPHD
jgi:hypothetical protein